MPYTRNTRIKTTKFKHTQVSVPEVEYRYPLTNKTKWERITHQSEAHINAVYNTQNDGKVGYEWAQAVIDEYHKLLDGGEYTLVVEYTKYPD